MQLERNPLRGFKGHPTHPPLTDIVIGGYAISTLLVLLAAFDVEPEKFGPAAIAVMGVTLLFGLPTIVTGVLDWLKLEKGSPVWKSATFHMVLMLLTGLTFFIAEEQLISGGAEDGTISNAGLAITLVGMALLTVGGWIGGELVFKHRVRVLDESETPTSK